MAAKPLTPATAALRLVAGVNDCRENHHNSVQIFVQTLGTTGYKTVHLSCTRFIWFVVVSNPEMY